MLLGNRRSFAIEIRPLSPSWERRYRPEATAWGALSLWVAGDNLCEHSIVGAESLADAVNVPLAPLADWLVSAWPGLVFEERARDFPTADALHGCLDRWADAPAPAGLGDDLWIDAREAWWSRHFIAAGAAGAILPGIVLARDDDRLVVQWRSPARTDEIEFIRPSGVITVDWIEAEQTLAGFVRFVAEWLRAEGHADLYAWLEYRDPLREMPRPLVAALEFYSGRSIDELHRLTGTRDLRSLLAVLGLPDQAPDPAGSPLTQVLRDMPPRLPAPAGHVLDELRRRMREGRAEALARLRPILRDSMGAATTPEASGQRAAAALRKELGLGERPVDEVPRLLADLGIGRGSAGALDGVRMVTGRQAGSGAAVVVVSSPRTKRPWGERFEEIRGLGHLLLDLERQGTLGAAASAFACGARRRRSGAFAAEFLLPEAALREASTGLDGAADPETFRTLMRRFGVGARTAAFQLWNSKLLSSADLRDDLIEAFAGE